MDGDLARLGELGDAAHELLNDRILFLYQGGEVEFEPGQLDAALSGMELRPGVVFAEVEQRFCRDAADVEAGAAEGGAFLDEGDLETELRGAEGAHVAAGAGADDGNVKGIHKTYKIDRANT